MRLGNLIKNNPFSIGAILLAACVCLVLTYFNAFAGAVALMAVACFAAFQFRWFMNGLARKKEQVRMLNTSLLQDKSASYALSEFPLASALVSRAGDILWYNELFERVLADFSDMKSDNVNAMFSFTRQLNEQPDGPFEVAGAERRFTVYPAAQGEDRFALYFVDDTELKNVRTLYRLSRPVLILINVDSLEQAEDQMPHEAYYGLNADIDRMITKWLVENGCVFRKSADGRYFAVTDSKNLQTMVDNRFSIVDKVRSARFGGDEYEITLSVGVCRSGDLRECEDGAREALDMARGRGGDQVAVKTAEGYEFFGGISAGKEKRGKTKSRSYANALDVHLDSAENVLVMGHAYSDFDCIGASAGVVAIARAKGRNVHVVTDKKRSMAKSMIAMLESGAGAISFLSPGQASEHVHENTLLVVVDTHRKQLVEAPDLLTRGLKTVIIDHHRRSVDHIGEVSLDFLEPYASSASEMVTELVEYSPSKPKLTPVLAQALLAGIMLDTKDFALRVGVRTFDAASYLRGCKADTVAVRELFCGTAEDNIRVNNIVNSAVYYDRFAIALSEVTGENARLICSKAADELLSIEKIDASFVISRLAGGVNISARSLGRINVQVIMERLGGGGHHSMAAAQLPDITPEEALPLLRQTVDTYLKEIAQ